MKGKENKILIGLLLVKVILPFILSNPVFELHRDEYLYYEQGHHLDFGYLENPPLIGLLAAVSSLFGGSFFWIKFWPSLFGVLRQYGYKIIFFRNADDGAFVLAQKGLDKAKQVFTR